MAKRLLSSLSVAIVAAFGSSGVAALGFGPLRATAHLGYPLDISIPVRLQDGEVIADECISAKVTSGDTQLAAAQISTHLETPARGEPRIRVRTLARIEEPFVTISLTSSCGSKLSREYTIFADPPPVETRVASAPASGTAPSAVTAAAVPASAPPVASQLPGQAPVSSSARASSGQVQPSRKPAIPDKPVTVAARAVPLPAAAPAAPAARAKKPERAEAPVPKPIQLARSKGPRLRLDMPMAGGADDQTLSMAMQQREDALATAKIAVDVAAAANSSANQRVTALEQSLESFKKEAALQRAAIEKLRGELDTADERGRWAPWLAVACLGLVGLAAFLYWRMRRIDALRLKEWMDEPIVTHVRESELDSVGPETVLNPGDAPVPAPEPAVPVPAARAEPVRSVAAAPVAPTAPVAAPVPAAAPKGPPSVFSETQPGSSTDLDSRSPPQDISIEELLDVEQQAEFFVVLGQDDAAIDLLTSHVMATGGASPMPFLKLLEIYRRIGDQTSYERTRKRFNGRFNGVAPDWNTDLNAGRALDDYPEVVSRIADTWPVPVDAMAELQNLMFRNHSSLLFDLPAYRDIMMLFTLARDLQETSSAGSLPPIDVLLPLSPPSSTASASGPAGQGAGRSHEPLDFTLDDEPLPSIPPPAASGRSSRF